MEGARPERKPSTARTPASLANKSHPEGWASELVGPLAPYPQPPAKRQAGIEACSSGARLTLTASYEAGNQARMQIQVLAVPPRLPRRFHSRAMSMASSSLCPHLANLQQAHKKQKPGNGTSGKMPGMPGPPLSLVHLLMLEVRAGFPTGGAGSSSSFSSDLSGSRTLRMANGTERHGAARVRAAKCCHNSLPWSNELHLPAACVGGM